MAKDAIADASAAVVLQFLLTGSKYEMIGQESIPRNNDPRATVSGWMDRFKVHPSFSSVSITETDEQRFNRLADCWRRDTAKVALVQKRAVHLSYQKIIGMGELALPFIFRELEKESDDWLWALTCIVDDDTIVSPDANFDEAVEQWLNWGRVNSYL